MSPFEKLHAQTDPVIFNWEIAGSLPSPLQNQEALGVAGPVTGVNQNRLIVAGGANFPQGMPWQGGKKFYAKQVYIFSRVQNHLALLTDTFNLPESIAYTANCVTSKGIFYAGGENENGISDKAYLLSWDTSKKTLTIQALPALPFPVTNAAATVCNDFVYMVGGENKEKVSAQCWALDLNKPDAGWKILTPVPKPVSNTVLVSVAAQNSDRLFLLGGRCKTDTGISTFYSSVFEYDIAQNQWHEKSPLPYALSAGTGVQLNATTLVLFGGDRGTTFHQVETALVAMTKTNDPAEKEKITQHKNDLLIHHPGFSKEILLYNIKTGQCQSMGNMPYAAPATTTAFWWGNAVLLPCGEIKAGVRTPFILMTTPQMKEP